MTLEQILEEYPHLNRNHDVIVRVECALACTFYSLLPQSYFGSVIYVSDTFLVLVFRKRTRVDSVREILLSVEHLVTDWAIL